VRLLIPTRTDVPAWSEQVQILGVNLELAMCWNGRGKFWSLSVSTQQGEPIALGIRVVADYDLWAQLQDARLPRGSLYALDTSGRGEPPGRADLGIRVMLIFSAEDAS